MFRTLIKPRLIRPSIRSSFMQLSTIATSGNVLDNNTTSKLTIADLKKVELPTNEKSEQLLKIRHSSAHVMAMAVQKLFPNIKVTIGPWIDNGFYYDFFVPDGQQLSTEDLKKIKKEMDRIIRSNYPITREEITREEARKRILALNEPFKLEILDSIKTEPITIYHIGDKWWDLCAGPHVTSTGAIPSNAVELQSLAGAYWRGDETKPMLQRVYGTAWENADQLELYNFRIAEAKRRDHRTIGKNMDLFSIQEDAGGGLVFWHPKGGVVRRLIEDYWKDMHLSNGYQILYTPHIANLNLWKTSGHFDFYRNDMFKTMEVDEDQYQIKPMNCPFHCLLFKNDMKSYKDLPLRWAELGTVYRYERSGTLHGLFRVRGFTQDDAHIFCLPSQLEDEIINVLHLIEKILNKFGFHSFKVMLSTRPKESVGSDDIWEKATTALRGALEHKGWQYDVDEGGGAFYGPKIDIKIEDAIGRKWQCSTVQCDFNLPERFDLEYVANDGSKQRPIMIHRAIFGSLERFFGILIEDTAGDFPLWIAPVQGRLLPVIDDVKPYCHTIAEQAKMLGIRMEVDNSGNRLNKLIRTAEQDKLPIIAVIGEKEMQTNTISLRSKRSGGDLGSYPVDIALKAIKAAIDSSQELTKEQLEDFLAGAKTTSSN
eukprot:gene10823-12033_t